MPKKIRRITSVRTHPMRVAVSKKNPDGIAIRHQHSRRVYESVDSSELKSITRSYKTKGIPYPSSGKLPKYKNSDNYDDLIAIWCNFFNKKFPPTPPEAALDPNIIKALLASESSFDPDPPGNPKATGIAQITSQTLRTLQDPDGEAKDYLFRGVLKRDLKDPEIAIPLAVRWLFRKRETARSKLKRNPTTEELILEYKGLLKSKTAYKQNALKSFKDSYDELKKK